ncbi:MAG: UDP-N-acetylmuramoyl-L-alanine--D-glutamate ligase [Tuberibacillus sp.]
MKQTDTFRNKEAIVLGLAKSGYAAAKTLIQLGAKVTVNDQKTLDDSPQARELEALGARLIGGGHPLNLLTKNTALMIKNPGIPYSNPLVQKALEQGVPVWTEVELAFMLAESEFVGITGSNGKTTTTMLTGEMLKDSEKSPIVAGNIGTALCEVVQEADQKNVIVAELSSFQLMGIEAFRPKVSVFLNLFEAHLDYHGSMEEYGKAKARITMNQSEDDYIVYNSDDERVSRLIASSKAKKVPFSLKESVEGAYLSNNTLYFKGEAIINRDELAMPNVDHNVANALAAIAVAKIYRVSNDFVKKVLKSFNGVPHRLQFIDKIQGRSFYNDSKATNILATTKALQAFDQPVILLAGGLDRGNSFAALEPYLKGVKAVIVFGQTKEKLMEAAKNAGVKTIRVVDNVTEAVPIAYELSEPGDVVLLSPACASWDQYRSFEERGDMFIKSVHTLK